MGVAKYVNTQKLKYETEACSAFDLVKIVMFNPMHFNRIQYMFGQDF